MKRRDVPDKFAGELERNPAVHAALVQLLEAHLLAPAGSKPITEAVELYCLLHRGASGPALHWLTDHGLAVRFGPKGSHFSESSRFALTRNGLKVAHASTIQVPANDRKPRWNKLSLELHLGQRLVKRFIRRAENQILILDAFEEQKWPECIDDPLPHNRFDDVPKRLHNAIQRLNSGHVEDLIRFHANGSGTGIRWELVAVEQITHLHSRSEGAVSAQVDKDGVGDSNHSG